MKCNVDIRPLKDLADIQTGPFGSQLHKEDYVEIGTPIVTVEHLGNRIFTEQNLPKVSDGDRKRLEKYLLSTGDIVFSRVGSVDRCSYVDERHSGWMFSGRCLRIRPSECINPLYLYYYFCLEEVRQFVRNIAVGATMPSINTKLLGEVPVSVPSIQTQRRIAAILSSLDDKIELNNKINANLERQAQALFKAWFDENSLNSKGTLGDIAAITMGQSPNGNSYNEDGKGTVFYQGRSEFGFRFPTRRLFTTEPKRMAKTGDILLSVRAPVGDLNVAYENCCIGRGLCALHSKDNMNSFLLYALRSLKPTLDVFNGEGTVFGSISRDDLIKIPVSIPCVDDMARFETTVRPMDDLIRANYKANCRLQFVRDKLLPKLMSGEII